MSKEELEDMRQEGILGMLQKINNFEPQRGFTIATFLSQRILGTFKDYVKKEITREKRNLIISKQMKIDKFLNTPSTKEDLSQYVLTLKNLKITKKLTKNLDINIEEIDNHNIIETINKPKNYNYGIRS